MAREADKQRLYQALIMDREATRKTRARREQLIMVILKEKLLAKERLIDRDWRLLGPGTRSDDVAKGATLADTAWFCGMELDFFRTTIILSSGSKGTRCILLTDS